MLGMTVLKVNITLTLERIYFK